MKAYDSLLKMSATNRRTYCFGSFRVDASRRVLYSAAGEAIELSSRAFDALLYLIEHPGQLLEKSTIIEAVWPNVIVEDNNLNQAVFAIRRALSDRADKPQYIATVPGRGFQFVAPVTTLDREVEQDERPASVPPATPIRVTRRVLPWFGWPIAVLVVGAALMTALSVLSPARTPPPHTLAVLPFTPMIPGEHDEIWQVGMADTLITQLSQTQGLIVSPWSSVRGYRGVDQDPVAAGRRLGVDSVLQGTFNYRAGRLRLSVRLINVENGSTRWASQFDESDADVYAVQDAIAAEVVAGLPGDVVGRADMHTLRGASDPETFNSYANARSHWFDRTPQDLELAIDSFRLVIARDPLYTLAYSGLADSYAVLAVFGAREPHEAFREARQAVDRALNLDPHLAEPHATMGHILVQYDFDWAGGEREYRRAIELNPQYSMTYAWLGMLDNYRGKFEEALEHTRKAHRLEPEQKVLSAMVGNVLYHARRYDDAIEQLKSTLAMDEHFDLALALLGRAHLHKGEIQTAIAVFESRRSQLLGKDADLVQAYAMAGQREKALGLLADMHERAKTEYVSQYEFAAAYVGLGEHDRALDALEIAYEQRAQHIAHLPRDPAFDGLRGNPRFMQLVNRLGL